MTMPDDVKVMPGGGVALPDGRVATDSYMVAVDGETVVGWLVWNWQRTGHVLDVWVDPARRREHIGTALLQAAWDWSAATPGAARPRPPAVMSEDARAWLDWLFTGYAGLPAEAAARYRRQL